ncbi:MAG TPA: phage portal protein, partial [Gaiellaceae bacterium]|nr:phage portal protein [Gaiellaceae bacterium]
MHIADLDWALSEFRDAARTERYELARAYYLGDHRLMFAGEKFRSTFGVMLKSLSDNLMPAVIDSLTDRLELTGFAPTMETDTEAAEDVWRVWQRNMMDLRANEVHRESLLTGDSYVIVWPGQDGKAGIWPQQAGSVAVRYSFDYPGRIDLAAKLWRATDGYWRLTLYYPDRLERYRSKAPNKTLPATRNASSKFESFLPPENNVPSVQALEAVGDGGSVLPNPH